MQRLKNLKAMETEKRFNAIMQMRVWLCLLHFLAAFTLYEDCHDNTSQREHTLRGSFPSVGPSVRRSVRPFVGDVKTRLAYPGVGRAALVF